MLTLADFRIRFPEFSTVSDDRINFFISDTLDQFDPLQWGALMDKGQAYFIACLLVFDAKQAVGNTGAGFPVSEQAAGDLSNTYANNISASTPTSVLFLESNSYGQYFLSLRDQICPGIYTVAGGQITLPITFN